MPPRAVLVSIRGLVQGVGFRAWTVRRASGLELRGWVRNEPDGSVTALIGGPDEAVAQMLDLFRIGPTGAKVTIVEISPADLSDLPPGFGQLR